MLDSEDKKDEDEDEEIQIPTKGVQHIGLPKNVSQNILVNSLIFKFIFMHFRKHTYGKHKDIYCAV